MKRLSPFIAATLLGLTMPFAASAQQAAVANPIYFGLKAGSMDIDASGFDNASNWGVFLGFTFWDRPEAGAFSIEGEYTRSFDDGDVRIGPVRGDWDAETLGLYGVYRTGGNAYLKAKAGYVNWDVSINGPGDRIEGDDSDFSYGLGLGFRLARDNGLELEYAVLSDDLDFFSLGFYSRF